MNDDSQILIARLLTHQHLRRDDKLVKRVLSDELFRAEVDARLLATASTARQRLIPTTCAGAARAIRTEIFARATSANNNFGLARDAGLVVCCGRRHPAKRERRRPPTCGRRAKRHVGIENRSARREHVDRHRLQACCRLATSCKKRVSTDLGIGQLRHERRGDVIVEVLAGL